MHLIYQSTAPNPSRSISLLASQSSNCKAIVGYINGVYAQAVVCGEDVTVRADLRASSYCVEHHARFHTQPRERTTPNNLSVHQGNLGARTCDVCGGAFQPKSYQSIACSDQCRRQKKNKQSQVYKRLKTAAKQASDVD